jgi:hypothetical protein
VFLTSQSYTKPHKSNPKPKFGCKVVAQLKSIIPITMVSTKREMHQVQNNIEKKFGNPRPGFYGMGQKI